MAAPKSKLVFCPVIVTDLIQDNQAHFGVNTSEPLTWSSVSCSKSAQDTKRNRFSNVTVSEQLERWEMRETPLKRSNKTNASLFPEYSKTH